MYHYEAGATYHGSWMDIRGKWHTSMGTGSILLSHFKENALVLYTLHAADIWMLQWIWTKPLSQLDSLSHGQAGSWRKKLCWRKKSVYFANKNGSKRSEIESVLLRKLWEGVRLVPGTKVGADSVHTSSKTNVMTFARAISMEAGKHMGELTDPCQSWRRLKCRSFKGKCWLPERNLLIHYHMELSFW